MATANNILEGLKIFVKHGAGYECAAEHDQFFAGQPEGKKLSKKEVDTLLGNTWFLDCGGCAEEHDDPSELFSDPDYDTEEARPQHRYTCNQWTIFV